MRILVASAALLGGLVAQPAAACTICHSPTSMGVRHLLFGHDLVVNAAAVMAPLPFLLLAVVMVAREPRGPTGR